MNTSASNALALTTKLWGQIYDKRPPGDPKDTLRELKAAIVKADEVGLIVAMATNWAAERNAIIPGSGELLLKFRDAILRDEHRKISHT